VIRPTGAAALPAVLLSGALVATFGHPSGAERLVFHAETADGRVVASERADELFNPASVIKVATSWWALERLGPAHRFTTAFGCTGRIDREAGRMLGDLVVTGGGDPDFHFENAVLVAKACNGIGLQRVDGDLVVGGDFWMGWENGAERPVRAADQRARVMGERLRDALDVRRWSAAEARGWRELCGRRGWDPETRWSLEISGRVRAAEMVDVQPLVSHRSNPLRATLRRFNVYSNNDIIRIADGLGGVAELGRFLHDRLGASAGGLRLATASGQGSNRMTARAVVEMLRGFYETLDGLALEASDVLVIPGCDPGPTRRMFPRLVQGPEAHTVVCKTGTLTATDGGVVALAGSFRRRGGNDVLFCMGSPRSGGEIWTRRREQQSWLLDLEAAVGGAEPVPCPDGPLFPDTMARVSVDHEGALR
jgi:D-alanyl-D-alanine carboxypeptidase/D-alanyl-D-alanine-endopeptidase (penicillin-binding protein 4)